MSRRRLTYSCNKIPEKTFLMVISQDLTCKEVLQKISKSRKDDYQYLFYEGSQIDEEDLIYDYLDSDKECIFYASTEDEPPTKEFMDAVMISKNGNKSAKPLIQDVKPPIQDVKPPIQGVKPPIMQVSPPITATDDKRKDDSTRGESQKKDHKIIHTPNPTPNPHSLDPNSEQYTPNPHIDTNASIIGPNPHAGGIYTKKVKPRVDVKGKYSFYFTGSTKDHLLKGIDVELDTAMNPNQCRNKLQEVLRDNDVNINNKQLIIYLPGGIPFIAGTLGDIYLKDDMKVSSVIYGVLTRRIPDNILNKSCLEICNVSDPDHKLLISPLCDSSDRGLSDMACLMGYLNHDGIKGDLLLKTCASTIHFPPLITSMNRIIERNQVVGRDVVTVCSTLYTYFRAYVPNTCRDNQVYEYALRMCNLISHIPDIPEKIPMMQIEVKPDVADTKFLSDLKLGPIVYFWRADVGEDFTYVDLDLQGVEAIENSYNIIASFTPIAPLSMRVSTGCTIVKGKDHEYLYLMQSPSKDTKSQNKVDIVDPMTGMTDSYDIESFAAKQGNTKADVSVANLIDPEQVKQIIMVDFDESKSMIGDLGGYVIGPKSKKDHRVTIAIQYLTAFANRTYGYRIPCIQGLVTFNDRINVRCPLSPLVPDFEDKGLKKVSPDSVTKLWDSLARCCQEIIKFRKDSKGKEIYKNAKSRILVISDGEDVNSSAKVEDVVKQLIDNEIIVDSVIISTEDQCKMLCAVCHATGGLAFRPEDVKQGLSLFEQSAFLNYEERKNRSDPLIPGDRSTIPSRLKSSQITEEFMNKARDNSKFDSNVLNQELIQAASNVRLATPRHVCAKNRETQIPNPRQRRILRELHAAAETNDIESTNYDPDMKIFTFQSNLDRWRVYLKGPEGTPYANKWWYLYVTFPELYPVQAPVFRFVSIPFHLNVSSEGRICLNSIEKGYISSNHVVDIIQGIKELFLLPSTDTPVQIETYDMFVNNQEEYKKLAKESADTNAKDDYKDFIGASLVVDDVPKDFKIAFTDHIPPYMLSQISGKPIQKDKMVKASSGVYYDKDELRQLVASNKNPVCVITGKILTEKPEDFDDPDDNDAL